jgi:hypothetical protein
VKSRAVVGPAALAFGTLAVLGVLIGWVGASRAYVVGVHTLYQDHLASVAFVLAGGALLAFLVGRTLVSGREVVIAVGMVVATDVAVAIAITLAIDEMRRHPEILRAVVAATGGGAQVAALSIGLVAGRLAAVARGRGLSGLL